MHERPERAGGYFARSFVHRHDAAGVYRGVGRGVAIRIVAHEDLELRVHDQQVAGVAVEFHLAVERDAHAGQEAIRQIAAMKPFGQQPLVSMRP